MMRIDVNGRFLTQPMTGVQRYAHEVLSVWDAQIHAGNWPPELAPPRILTPTDAPQAPWRNLPQARIPGGSGQRWEQTALPRAVSGDVLFSPCNSAPLLAFVRSRPVVVTVHDLSYRYFPDAYTFGFRAWYACMMPIVMARASRIITVSESERSAILGIYPSVAKKLSAIQNGGGLPTVPISHAPPREGRYLLYVGSLSRRKNFPGVLAAFAELVDIAGLRLVVVGGTPSVFRSYLPDLPAPIADRIDWLGQVNDAEQLASLYRGATAFVFPSFYEASPLPPIEAMSFGCPVVSSTIPSLVERCGDAASYCDPASVADIARAARRVVEDSAYAEELRARGYRRAAGFSWETCANATLQILREAIRP